MLRFRRTVVAAAVLGTLTAGALTASVLTVAAHAGSAAPVAAGVDCHVAATARPSCYLAEAVRMPLSASVSVTSQPAQNATVSWTVSCQRNGNATATTGTATAMTPFQAKMSIPRGNAADCTLTANVNANGSASMTAGFAYSLGRPWMIAIPQGANYSGQPIYALRCVTDPGNNPALRAPVVIRGCEVLYSQAWTFSNGELIHGRYCLTDKGNGGAGSKIILYTCTHAADQVWTYRPLGVAAPEGEFVLKSHSGRLCLNDPRTSVAYGTQLIVSACSGGNSERWYTG